MACVFVLVLLVVLLVVVVGLSWWCSAWFCDYCSLPWLSQDGVNVLSAVVGDVSGSVWLCPSEVIKQQMQSASEGQRVGLRSAVKGCWDAAGIKGFYQGYGGAWYEKRGVGRRRRGRTGGWAEREMLHERLMVQGGFVGVHGFD
jgi:hypothetical protein